MTVTGVGGDGVLYTTGLTGTDANSYSLPWSFSNANYKSADESGTLAFTITPAATTTTVTINGVRSRTAVRADAGHGDGDGPRPEPDAGRGPSPSPWPASGP